MYLTDNPKVVNTAFPAICRAILVDIGTGRYLSGSLPWFTDIYRQRGIEFSDIFGAHLMQAARVLIPIYTLIMTSLD